MRIAIIGLGDIAQKAYLPIVANHPSITPVLCTRNSIVLRNIAAKYRIQETYNDIDDVLANRPDAVMIHTSTDSHFSLAKQCLQAGVAVFIDKPVSYYYAECEQLVNLAIGKNIPLIVGFNRRFAPLYQLFKQVRPVQVFYQKNRYNLPAAARQLVFDDFIHVVDFVRHCAGQMPEDIDIFAHRRQELLASVQIQWQHQGGLFCASMNRINGLNEERLEYFADNKKWQIENLRHGQVWQDNTVTELGFDDWQTTLYKRGFVAMVDDMLVQLEKGINNPLSSQQILDTHYLCEQVTTRVNNQN
ncbi:Gfo/Idh/MocA family protein [Neptunicella sp. SCSIO 80796]|uniref:Gfo/Idh/MocA family protein n=1 Tax=Neptunicella plasticusilytica TaxID=3117012 RepID=UPI003A4D79FC